MESRTAIDKKPFAARVLDGNRPSTSLAKSGADKSSAVGGLNDKLRFAECVCGRPKFDAAGRPCDQDRVHGREAYHSRARSVVRVGPPVGAQVLATARVLVVVVEAVRVRPPEAPRSCDG